MKDVTKPALPTDTAARKDVPMATGVLDYFPAALAEVAKLSKVGNDKHNPGEDLHWARGKSMDHADCIVRHLAERGTIDTDGLSHSVKVAWRALALLQEELEAAGAPMARGARVATVPTLTAEQAPEPPKWKCRGCGSMELWGGYERGTRSIAIQIGGRGPLCDSFNCFAGMERV